MSARQMRAANTTVSNGSGCNSSAQQTTALYPPRTLARYRGPPIRRRSHAWSKSSQAQSYFSQTQSLMAAKNAAGGCLKGLFQSLARPTHGTARLLCARGMTKEFMRGAFLQLPRDMQVAMAAWLSQNPHP